jgi:hypothetical protein
MMCMQRLEPSTYGQGRQVEGQVDLRRIDADASTGPSQRREAAVNRAGFGIVPRRQVKHAHERREARSAAGRMQAIRVDERWQPALPVANPRSFDPSEFD